MKVAVFGRGGGDSREVQIARAMARGARHHGHEVIELDKIPSKLVGDVLISYGWIHELDDQLFSKYKRAGKHYVFVDLGYWGRSHSGFHRVSVDNWDSLHTLKEGMPQDRLNAAKMRLRHEWDPNSKHVMVAGMSSKAARSHGYRDQEWEKQTARTLNGLFPNHRVSIRQKPRKNNHVEKLPRIIDALKSTYFAASHHSNVSVDCLWAGVPYWCVKGVGKPLSVPSLTSKALSKLKAPTDSERLQLLANIAYVQYDLDEMARGVCWDYIKDFIK